MITDWSKMAWQGKYQGYTILKDTETGSIHTHIKDYDYDEWFVTDTIGRAIKIVDFYLDNA